MHLRLFDYLMWFIAPFLQTGVVVAMYRRKLISSYARFFQYIILQVISVPVLALLFYRSYTQYYYSYWVNEVLTIIVSFAALYEASRIVFDQDDDSLKVLQILWTALILIGFVLLATTTPPSRSLNGSVTGSMMLADRALRVFQIVLLIGFTVFSAWLRVSSRSFIYGIVLGFGFFATVNTIVSVAVAHAAFTSVTLSRINSAAYVVTAMIWLAYAIYGSADPRGSQYSLADSPVEREIQDWIDRNFKDPRMSAARTRNLG